MADNTDSETTGISLEELHQLILAGGGSTAAAAAGFLEVKKVLMRFDFPEISINPCNLCDDDNRSISACNSTIVASLSLLSISTLCLTSSRS